MQFTRDPIIETIITPQEGHKLVIRNSKSAHGEEFFVDAVQVVTVGNGCFFRSLEKPKPFMVPANDYEIVETRDTRMVLKIPGAEKGGIKIGGGRETSMKMPREAKEEEVVAEELQPTPQAEPRGERRKEKRRMRRRRGERFEREEGEAARDPQTSEEKAAAPQERQAFIIPPPSTLISDTIARYKDIPGFASAFFEKGQGVGQEEGSNDVDGNVKEVIPSVGLNEDEEENFNLD